MTTITLPGGTSLQREDISLPFEKSSLPVKMSNLLKRGKILLSSEQKMFLPGGKYLQEVQFCKKEMAPREEALPPLPLKDRLCPLQDATAPPLLQGEAGVLHLH